MKWIKRGAFALVVLIALSYLGARIIIYSRIPAASVVDVNDEKLIEKGKYIARLADCAACHSLSEAKPYTGGLAMQTPIGAIFSPNITPDKDTGIGKYSFQDFQAAVQYGVRRDGAPLYPAMSFPSYVIMPKKDIEALYAYFMKGVEPVRQVTHQSTIPPILNMRWPVAYWSFLFSPDREFTPDPTKSELYNHGAYLVEGPGHCGACHTPRGIGFQEKSMHIRDGNDYLSGAVIDGWRAKSLRGEARGLASWTEDELIEFFKTGRTDKVAAFGAMKDMVQHSSQYFTDYDLKSIATYLKALPPAKGKELTLPKKQDETTAALLAGQYVSKGAVLYVEHCAACHRLDGNGAPRIIPALNNNSAVYARFAQSTIQIILEGGEMAKTSADKMAFAMPNFRYLSDGDIAEVVNFIRNNWQNQAPLIDASDVAEIRLFLSNKTPNAPIAIDAKIEEGRHE